MVCDSASCVVRLCVLSTSAEILGILYFCGIIFNITGFHLTSRLPFKENTLVVVNNNTIFNMGFDSCDQDALFQQASLSNQIIDFIAMRNAGNVLVTLVTIKLSTQGDITTGYLDGLPGRRPKARESRRTCSMIGPSSRSAVA